MYRNQTNVFKLILYLFVNFVKFATSMNSFISQNCLLVEFLGYSMWYHSICKEPQYYFFASILDAFISFSSLIAVVRTSSITWIKVVRVGILHLFLISEEKLSAFHHWVWVSWGLVICSFYYVSVCILHTHFVESFYHI